MTQYVTQSAQGLSESSTVPVTTDDTRARNMTTMYDCLLLSTEADCFSLPDSVASSGVDRAAASAQEGAQSAILQGGGEATYSSSPAPQGPTSKTLTSWSDEDVEAFFAFAIRN
ncbi:hypothetical protein GN244_ATG04387 [Phytophthora infestans]|uniref:Uncharacterized protein n=1 Tax=Phytophthora infestans TaxID=4787 RepID=A0A833THB4_PHYIN|nr:hypothetical protein GN244_ATG04387 [Phytophthora infestans]KAF4149512.1 hypothetical protein GN958_ATG01327 [Phytophthora infestans]